MITIQVTNQQGVVRLLELYPNDPININYRYTDIEDIGRASSSFTQTFRIPATEVNREVFNDFYNPNLRSPNPQPQTMFNPKVRMKAAILVNTVPVVTGYVQLKNTVTGNNLQHEFTVAFFGETNEFIKEIGDKKLHELDWSSLNHNINSTIVQNSWAGGFPAASPGDIVYGFIDKGYLFSDNGFGQPITGNNPLRAGQFTPFVRLRRVIDEIFTQSGYNLKSNIFQSSGGDTEDMYMPFWVGGQAIKSIEQIDLKAFAARRSSPLSTTTAGAGATVVALGGDITGGVSFDQTGDYSGGQFTPSVSGFYRFNLGARCYCNVPWLVEARLAIRRSPTELVYLQPEYTEVSQDSSNPTQLAQSTPYVWMEQGQSYELALYVYHVSAIPAGNPLVVTSNNTLPTSETTGWDLLPNSVPTAGVTVDMDANCPDITILDFLRSMQAKFNLVLLPDAIDPFTMRLETWVDFMNSGSSKDWTEYIDNSSDVVIKPTTDIQRKRYEWRYSEGGDILNQAFIVNADRTFGRFLITDPENDFATGEHVVQTEFVPYPVNALGQNNLTNQWLIHKGYDVDGKVIKDAPPRLAYYGGLFPIGGVGIALWDDSSSSVVQVTSPPHFGNYDVKHPTAADRDLNFGGDVPLHNLSANPVNNLYNTYWRPYVSTLYGQHSRVMEARFKLDAGEVSTFDFNDRIFIKDAFWRVIDIQYTPNGDDTARVKLLKDFMDTPPCDVTPAGSNAQGIVNFIDGSGSPAAATEQCCELFGYSWVNIGGTFQCAGAIYDTDPAGNGRDPIINTNNGGGISGGGVNVEVGSAIGWGQDVFIPNGVSGVIGGNKVSVSQSAGAVIAAGEKVLIDFATPGLTPALNRDLRGVLAVGINTHAFDSGYHRGGGSYWNTVSLPSIRGQAQNGELTWVYEGGFDDTDEVELFLNGVDGQRLFFPNQSAMYLRLDVVVIEMDFTGGVYLPNGVYGATWRRALTVRNQNVLMDSTAWEAADEEVNSAGLRMRFTPTTDAQAQIEMDRSTSNSKRCRIVATGHYVMAKI